MRHWTFRNLGRGAVYLSLGLLAAVPACGQLQISISNHPPAGFDLQVTGVDTGFSHQLEFSEDLPPSLWDPLTTFSTLTGLFDFSDHPPSGTVHRAYRARRLPFPQFVEYSGTSLVLIVENLVPGSEVQFDLDGNGSFEYSVVVDSAGVLTAVLDLSSLPSAILDYRILSGGGPTTPGLTLMLSHTGADGPSREVPANLLPDSAPVGEPGISVAGSSSFGIDFTHSRTPTVNGVELATGKLRQAIPILSMKARILDFCFDLYHVSQTDYAGAFGQSVSHRYNMMLIRDTPTTGTIITPDARIFPIRTVNGTDWTLPEGFHSRLTLNPSQNRWTLTHFNGQCLEFFCGLPGQPGLVTSIREPNGNQVRFAYDGSGYLQRIRTSLEQMQTFAYDKHNRLVRYRDHLGYSWTFAYDGSGRLTRVHSPSTDYLDVPADTLISEADLASLRRTGTRSTTYRYDSTFPNQIASITDARSAVPVRYAYDPGGRVQTVTINGAAVHYVYQPLSGPEPLGELDSGNIITRVIDRDGNICDYEMHDDNGGPLGAAAGGLRRTVHWTETGTGGAPLRTDEPVWWETRWLYDNEDLKPSVATQPFSNSDARSFRYDANRIPMDWPRTEYTYNANRQITRSHYTDGTDSVRSDYTYQPGSFGDAGEYSRLLTATDPRASDTNPLYAGLSFLHSYQYDSRGNLTQYTGPTITRGTATPKVIVRGWDYNQKGQIIEKADGNGNVVRYAYHTGGPSTGGDINSAQFFNGYLKSITRGATGSADMPVDAVTEFKVNALGMVTERIDPERHRYRYEYNALRELVRVLPPPVTLFNSSTAQYETEYYYDPTGNIVLTRGYTLEHDGIVGPNAWNAIAKRYNGVNNCTGMRVEVDSNPANDLITNVAYDPNDQLAVIERPEGNRTFFTYDERRLPLRRFYGVAPGGTPTVFYPPGDAETTLDPGAAVVGVETYRFDARGNLTVVEDGRGNLHQWVYDFANRLEEYQDPNGNGVRREYDDAGLILLEERGSFAPFTGITLARTYYRYDEAGRCYQTTQDIKLSTDERGDIDPTAGVNSSTVRGYDRSHRLTRGTSARGNDTTYAYDAANRLVSITDAKNNSRTYDFDRNANRVRMTENEVSDGGPLFIARSYQTTYRYDELNRRTEMHMLGETGTSIDHAHTYTYDSRNNLILYLDAEGNAEFSTYDLLNRRTMQQRFDGAPVSGTPTELRRTEFDYDGNHRLSERRVWANVLTPSSIQSTKYAYDDLDRLVRIVHPDSDDPISGAGNGPDGLYDRVEWLYDQNSNPVRMTEQRGVVFDNQFDLGNRLTQQAITRPPNVFGVTFRSTAYDDMNRPMSVRNDYAECAFTYDSLSRVRTETQSIRLDGTGATAGYEQPIEVQWGYDKDSNVTRREVMDGTTSDLEVTTPHDSLNRPTSTRASYVGGAVRTMGVYTWFGPHRLVARTLGNGAKLVAGYDTKRRPTSHVWTPAVDDEVLVGIQSGHDNQNNPLFRQFLHDDDRYDHFRYNDRYELDGAEYRRSSATPPASPTSTFAYDDNRNRIEAWFNDPFNLGTLTIDNYANNAANEYTTLSRNTALPGVVNPVYDRAGNATVYTVRAPSPSTANTDGNVFCSWDAHNRLHAIAYPAISADPQHYRYDPMGRRIATLEGSQETPVRRYIWCGDQLLSERLFDPGASLSNAPSTVERIYVPGLHGNDPVLCAIDGNLDGTIGGGFRKNDPTPGSDQEYFYLSDPGGTVMALSDADDDQRVLEYYRHDAFGNTLVLPVVDGDSDGYEDTPSNLTDNACCVLRGLSEFDNPFLRGYFDRETGLYALRNEYYDPGTGRRLNRGSYSLKVYGYSGAQNSLPAKQVWEYSRIPIPPPPARTKPESHGWAHTIESPRDVGSGVSPASGPMFHPSEFTISKSVPWEAHVLQHNQSSLSFLPQRAQAVGVEETYFNIELSSGYVTRIPAEEGAVRHPDFAWMPYANAAGHASRPIVIGALWNGGDAPPSRQGSPSTGDQRPPMCLFRWGNNLPASTGPGNGVRFFKSRSGHPIIEWTFEKGWPAKWEGPSLSSDGVNGLNVGDTHRQLEPTGLEFPNVTFHLPSAFALQEKDGRQALSQRYTMFLGDGTPVRSESHTFFPALIPTFSWPAANASSAPAHGGSYSVHEATHVIQGR